ncbi:acetyl-CoA carboxylase, carboxyltransferase subunit beta [Clostridium frigidicarnis]|uniref:Multifunctional fusion protein n=1 Tax=Clostridium frigidicarnis TaxID=84698 RepID=A0A1I0Y605_9CLOT|nr:acetyl-CoA carboxylase, carboxyltransferase subunit beta [Clostridium frigidicarnis]SFB07878.1 acetyl-CoA carboxylase carboxyltransferase subunit alpha [Clostridium frigidicarnis]
MVDGILCFNCKNHMYSNDMEENLNVCKICGQHFKLDINTRIKNIFDTESVKYFDTEMYCNNPLNFPTYSKKIDELRKELKSNSAVVTGYGTINANPVYFAIMDYRFLMGSMGIVEGEKITRVIERATENNEAIVIFTGSGGVRIQEGTIAVYQMSKVATAIKKHNDKGLLFISVITDPTFGGVTASIATLGDIIIAEPNANIGFAGRRVIEQTIRQQLSKEFQTSEFMINHGFIDCIIDRRDLRNSLAYILKFHKNDLNRVDLKYPKMQKYDQNLSYKSSHDKLTPWQKVKAARKLERIRLKDYINMLITGFIELKGDRKFKDDKAFICGIGYLKDLPITIVGTARGRNIKDNIDRNFGSAHPEGYRKALRLMKQAEKFNRPILCFIDTPGAACDVEAEERGQGEAIARCLMEISSIRVPIITIIHGEGGSGGALAISNGDYVYMLENATYSVISPEAGAAIIHRDSKKAEEIAAHLKLTASDILNFGIIDCILPEPTDKEESRNKFIKDMKETIYIKFLELMSYDKSDLINNRHFKIRSIGNIETNRNEGLQQIAAEKIKE